MTDVILFRPRHIPLKISEEAVRKIVCGDLEGEHADREWALYIARRNRVDTPYRRDATPTVMVGSCYL